jgi:cytidylate kinase
MYRGYGASASVSDVQGALTEWLASQLQVWFSAGFSTGERKKRITKKDDEKKNDSKKKNEQRKFESKYRGREQEG